ncbi:hypothetical protein PISMIDRAFT_674090, partial [Pisolithus microcarpus 441]
MLGCILADADRILGDNYDLERKVCASPWCICRRMRNRAGAFDSGGSVVLSFCHIFGP